MMFIPVLTDATQIINANWLDTCLERYHIKLQTLWTWYDQLGKEKERENRMKNFWRKMWDNVKLRSKKLRTMSNERNEQVVKLDENGGRKDDEWLWVSLLNGPRETGSSTVMAFSGESIHYNVKWLVNYVSLKCRFLFIMLTWI